jgi:hypothetical protein
MEKSGVPDYLPQLTQALMKSRALESTINNFAAYWKALPADSKKLPCPLCFARGRQGWLVTMKENGVVTAVQCERCREEIIIPRIH